MGRRLVAALWVLDLNALLKAELADDLHDTESYIFGTYDLNQRVEFRTLSVQSAETSQVLPDAPLRFLVRATGRLRYQFKDGIVGARVTAKVRTLSGRMEFTPVSHEDGVGLDYRCVVDALKISVDNMSPWLERKLAGELKESIERSQNKRRRRGSVVVGQ